MWLYDGKEFTEDMIGDYVGFVYIITVEETGKRYIGKKNFTKPKTYQKNKKKKRKIVPSDWVTYCGSNKELQDDVARGIKIYKEIIRLCKSKSEMAYYETFHIFNTHALLREDYYNSWVSCRINQNTLKKIRENETNKYS